MFSPAYNAAVEFAAAIIKGVKESGYEMDYPLGQLISESACIGEKLLSAEISKELVPGHKFQSNLEESYKDGIRYLYLSLYWIEILETSGCYSQIPFPSIKEKWETLQGLLRSGMKVFELMLGKGKF
ncbi:MAG: hypothetical protein K2M13_04060 [Muribaculaceae bacterium]|nr:hypothetical protein [Muribaculaceae bacterium]